MKTHFLKIPEQRPAARTHLERGRGVPNASTGTRGDSDQGGMNRMHSLFGRIPAVVWSGALAFVLTVFTGGIWTVLLISNAATSPAIPWAVAVMALLLWMMWQYLGGKWGPLSTGQAAVRSGICLGPGGGLTVNRGPGRVLDRVVPTREDTRSCPSELLRISVAHRGARAGDGLAGFLPRRGSRFPGVLPGHSGTKGERSGRHRDCSPSDCTGARPDAGVLVAHPAVVLFRGRDVRWNGLPYEVDSTECRGS